VALSHKLLEMRDDGVDEPRRMGVAGGSARAVVDAGAMRCRLRRRGRGVPPPPLLAGPFGIHDATDLVTPFAVVGAALAARSRSAPP
jgi:hypothetical protein